MRTSSFMVGPNRELKPSIIDCVATFFKVAEMETILQQHNNTMPSRDVLVTLAEKFRWAFISFNLLSTKIVLLMHFSFDVVSQQIVKARLQFK